MKKGQSKWLYLCRYTPNFGVALYIVVWYLADTAWVLLMVIIGYSYVDPVREVVMCFPQTRDASRLCVDKRSSSGGIAGR